MFGTHYIFQVSIAILRLIQYDLVQLDLSGINDYLKSFKEDEKAAFQGASSGGGVGKSKLPPIETIIEESFKVKLNEDNLDKLKKEYKRLHAPRKEDKKNKIKKLGIVKQ